MARQPTALITGCGEGGIGHALAAEFIKNGYRVVATLLPHENQKHLTDLGIHVFVSDVTSDADARSLNGSVLKLTDGRLEVLVNNAGIIYTMPATDQDIDEVSKMFAVNVFGPMRMVRVFQTMIVASKGTVVNIGSIGGIVPYIYGASYNASKAALAHYGNTLRAEMKPFGVRVLNIMSGEVNSNLLKREVTGRVLPDDSLFKPLESEFRAHLNRTPSGTDAAVYAAAVVREVRKPTVAVFWFGSSSSFVYWYDAFMPKTYWDGLFWKWFNFDKLKKALEDGK